MKPENTYDQHVIDWHLSRTIAGQMDGLRRAIYEIIEAILSLIKWTKTSCK